MATTATNTTAPSTNQSNPTTSTTVPAADPAQPSSSQDARWTEADYLSALSHITHLQSLVSNLRDTIPSLTRPLTSFQPSRQPSHHSPAYSDPHDSPPQRRRGSQPTASSLAEERRKRKDTALAALRQAATEGVKGVKELRRDWEAERTGEVLRRARESRGKDGDIRIGMKGKVEGEGDSEGW